MTNFSKQDLLDPSGFPTLGPAQSIALQRMLNVIREQYELAGYSPLETAIVEREKILNAKEQGEASKQIYGLRLLNPDDEADDDSKDLALRFDHTVPLARYVAANHGNIPFPFRRYVIGPVFRGERPKDGRYRQFIQADIDIIGDETLNFLHDAEMVGVINGVFSRLEIGSFTVRVNNRKVLEGLLAELGIKTSDYLTAINVIDRLEKDGLSECSAQLVELGVKQENARNFLVFLTEERSTDTTMAALQEKVLSGSLPEDVFEELQTVVNGIRQLQVPEENFTVDLSIARGLAYYTATVYETALDEYPNLGSIASGGRFDELAELFTNKSLPGVGISIGVSRLLLRLIKVGLISTETSTIAPVLVTTADDPEKFGKFYLSIATSLREAGIATELYLAKRSLGKQMKFANRRGFKLAVIAREEDISKGNVNVRNMITGDQETVPVTQVVEQVQKMLSS